MRTLRYGATGNDVRTLQGFLGVSVDGVFGPKTRDAVKAYQTSRGLEADGIVGPLTWAALQGTSVVGKQPVDYKQYDSRWGGIKFSTHTSKQTIRNSGCGPTAMANILATFFDPAITPKEVAATVVKKGYRTYNSGTAWGFFGWVAKQYEFSGFQQTKNHDAAVAALAKDALIVASMGPGYWTSGGHFITLWKFDGVYMYANDPASATRKRQKFSDFKKQVKQYFIFFAPIGWGDELDEPEPVLPVEPEPTPVEPIPEVIIPEVPSTPSALFKGSKGDEVKALQTALMRLGYSCGRYGADGDFGTDTEKALISFQNDFGLDADGLMKAVDYEVMQEVLKTMPPLPELPGYIPGKGIYDVSKWQGKVDWDKAAKSGKIGLMILRAGYGQETVDERFIRNITHCQKYGIPVAVYWYSYAYSVERMLNEMESFYKLTAPYKPLWWCLDAEEASLNGAMIDAGTKKLRELGADRIVNYIANHRFVAYKFDKTLPDAIWIPYYNKTKEPSHRPCDLWQYGGEKVAGIGTSAIDGNWIPKCSRFTFAWFLGLDKKTKAEE